MTKKRWLRLPALLLALLLVLLPAGCALSPSEQDSTHRADPSAQNELIELPVEEDPLAETEDLEPPEDPDQPESTLPEDGWYSSKEEVALYLHLYGHLPENFVTKKQAQQAGWTGGNVERYTGEGTALGGSTFGNYEERLPKAKGRTYQECDIDTVGASSRGAKRIVFSNDGLIYYTEDHYESFELLYGEP